jgi:hypothetical protein
MVMADSSAAAVLGSSQASKPLISLGMPFGFGVSRGNPGFAVGGQVDLLALNFPVKIGLDLLFILTEGEGDSRYQWESDNDICRDTETGRFASKSKCGDGEADIGLDVDAAWYYFTSIRKEYSGYTYSYFYVGPGARLGPSPTLYATAGWRGSSLGLGLGAQVKAGYRYFALLGSFDISFPSSTN